ncbi:MAG: hypothetical protein ACI3WQ_08220 [Faecousia sp.]
MEMQMPGGHLPPPVQKLAVSLLSAKRKGHRFPYPIASAPHRGAVLFWKKQEGIEPMEMQMPGGHLPPPVQKLAVSLLPRSGKVIDSRTPLRCTPLGCCCF